MTDDSSMQRISRLTPLSAVLSIIDRRVVPVAPRQNPRPLSVGAVLAQDVSAPSLPPAPVALRDGYAVEAAAIADAGAYAPVPFRANPKRVDAGEPMPPGTDAVTPFDAVIFRNDRAEAVAAIAPGEGVLPAGADARAQIPLRRAGERVRSIDKAVLTAACLDVSTRRPRICIARGEAAKSAHIEGVFDLLDAVIFAAGAWTKNWTENAIPLRDALAGCDFDAVIAVGGTGSGRHDASVRTLARLGRVEVHGIAISPGETAAFGFANTKFDAVDEKPVLLLPGRVDAALAALLLIGEHLIARLAGGKVEDGQTMLPLKRKVTSTIGLVELIPVSCVGGMAEPLASGYLPLGALARSDGWLAIPAESEGFAAGTPVAVRPWP